MRLTTKIVLGIIISIFLLSFGIIVTLLFNAKRDNIERFYTSSPRILQENIIPVDIEPYKTIWIDETDRTSNNNIYPAGSLLLKPAIKEEDKNKLFLPEELLPFTTIISSNDTLIIRLKMEKLCEKYAPKSGSGHTICSLQNVNFFLHSNTVDVICNVQGIKVDVQNIKTDHIKINTCGEINIESCQAKRIEPYTRNSWNKFMLKNSQVEELNIDLDAMHNWQIENCDIEVENRTGSGHHRADLPKGAAKIVNWIPKNKDARLEVTLYGDTARVVFQ